MGGGREGTGLWYLANSVDGPVNEVVDEMRCFWEEGRKIDISHLSHSLALASEYLNSAPENFRVGPSYVMATKGCSA